MKKINLNYKEIFLLIFGSILMGIGAYLSNLSGFGGDSVAVLWLGMAKKWNITQGMANNIFNALLLTFLFFKDRKYIGIGTVVSPLVQSFTMDILGIFLIPIQNTVINFFLMTVGIIILSIGCGVYAVANLGLGAYIGMVMSISKQTNKSVSFIKISADFVTLMIALYLGAKASLGPIFNLLISGPIMDKTINILKN